MDSDHTSFQVGFRVTFTQPGVFDYKCSLHDALGMVRQIIVVPKPKAECKTKED